jgi:predicted nucleotidyltransferase
MLESCEFPKLPSKYDRALRDAVAFVLASFKPVGIIASGTIVRGNPDPTSDLDLWVIHFAPVRQRIQKFFNAVPAEIFVNPPWVIQTYFAQDQASARPISAHMMATGFVVLATDPVVEELRRKAKWLLTQPPDLTPEAIVRARYAAATRFEDALDIAARNPIGATMLLSQTLIEMLRFAFLKAQRFIPRDKDLLDEFRLLDADCAAKAQHFFESSDGDERIRLATEIADRILGLRGFFEWSSDPEIKKEPGSAAT